MSIRLSRRLRNRSLSSLAGLGTGWGRIGLSSRFGRESQPRRRRKTLLDLAHEIASFFADQAQIQAIPNTLRRPNPPYSQALRVFRGRPASWVLPQRLFRAAAWIAIGASIAPATAEPAKRSSNWPGFGFATNQRAASRHGSGTVLARFRVESAASRSSPWRASS